jgi:hypothetical protein
MHMQEAQLADMLGKRWQHIRGMTYDFVDVLQPSDLGLALPFPEARPIGYQLWCMTGAHESYLRHLEHGEWQGFSCSMDTADDLSPAGIKRLMQQSDTKMLQLLGQVDLEARLKSGEFGYELVQQMIEHEMHHQGQLINLIFCHHLPIPQSWQAKWALSYED